MIKLHGLMDVAEQWQLGLQDGGSTGMEEMAGFHDQVMFVVVVISIGVLWMITRGIIGGRYNRYLSEGTAVEIIWTIIPGIILIWIAIPSLRLLYIMDEIVETGVTIKVVGNQWYWTYEYGDYEEGHIKYDSYMIPTDELQPGGLRLLEVDNRMVVPVNVPIRLMVTASDVLHSFAIPSMGIKMDGVPGRLNQTGIYIKRPGIFYGQCSEICGANHSFMPIVMEAVTMGKYIEWIKANIEE